MIRKWLKLAGKGVLNRSLCHNTEDLITFDNIRTIHPLKFFSFEENDKVYGFHVETMVNVFNDKTPKNPYTRTPILFRDRKRFRKLLNMCTAKEKINLNPWIHIAHMIEENGSIITSRFILSSYDDPEFIHSFMISLTQKFTDLVHFGLIEEINKTFKYALWLRFLASHETTNIEQKFGNILFTILNESSNLTAKYYTCLITDSMLNNSFH